MYRSKRSWVYANRGSVKVGTAHGPISTECCRVRNALSAAGENDADNPLTPMRLHRVHIHTTMVATGLHHGPVNLAASLRAG